MRKSWDVVSRFSAKLAADADIWSHTRHVHSIRSDSWGSWKPMDLSGKKRATFNISNHCGSFKRTVITDSFWICTYMCCITVYGIYDVYVYGINSINRWIYCKPPCFFPFSLLNVSVGYLNWGISVHQSSHLPIFPWPSSLRGPTFVASLLWLGPHRRPQWCHPWHLDRVRWVRWVFLDEGYISIFR